MNIFITKLAEETTSDDLYQLFYPFGIVNSAKVMIDYETGLSKRYGFVKMENEAEALRAIKELNNTCLDNSHIVVKAADHQNNKV